MIKFKMNLTNSNYDIIICDNLLDNLSSYIKEVYNNKKIYIITDDIVKKLYLDKVISSLKNDFIVDYVVIKNGEESKVIDTYIEVCKELIDKDIRRNQLLLALGGGVVGDLTGFIASTLYRGLPYIGIPTTLLSQMDSSIGGKTGIDFYDRKNILGCFKQPLRVLIDPLTLNTLSKREFNNGMGELIKHSMIGNAHLLDMLLNKPRIDEKIIYESLSVKKRVVELDEFDQNERMTLNFGHTFGHIIELKYGFKHGEAVSIGMLMAMKLGIELNISKKSDYDKLLEVLKLFELPTYEYNYKDYLNEVFYDKKNLAGVINFIFVPEIGSSLIYKIKEEDLKKLK